MEGLDSKVCDPSNDLRHNQPARYYALSRTTPPDGDTLLTSPRPIRSHQERATLDWAIFSPESQSHRTGSAFASCSFGMVEMRPPMLFGNSHVQKQQTACRSLRYTCEKTSHALSHYHEQPRLGREGEGGVDTTHRAFLVKLNSAAGLPASTFQLATCLVVTLISSQHV